MGRGEEELKKEDVKRDEADLVIVCNLFNHLLDSLCRYLDFCILCSLKIPL